MRNLFISSQLIIMHQQDKEEEKKDLMVLDHASSRMVSKMETACHIRVRA